jgi:SAM-dependent methyltransferase
MPSRSLVRVMLVGAGIVVAALLAFTAYRHLTARPEPQTLPPDFDPRIYVRGGAQLDAPYLVTDYDVVDAMLSMAQVRPDDFVVDLGSGDGRILIAAAKSHGARGLGVDIDPARVREAARNAQTAGVSQRVEFRREDLFQTPIAEADVVTLYLTPEVNLRLRPRILAQMRPGARVVSHDYDMGDWRADQRQRIGTATVFLWIVPARLAGRWSMTIGGQTLPLEFQQHYQQLHGVLGGARVEQGVVSGPRVRFVASVGGVRRVFEGRLEGNAIVPVAADAGWRAVRAG